MYVCMYIHSRTSTATTTTTTSLLLCTSISIYIHVITYYNDVFNVFRISKLRSSKQKQYVVYILHQNSRFDFSQINC